MKNIRLISAYIEKVFIYLNVFILYENRNFPRFVMQDERTMALYEQKRCLQIFFSSDVYSRV